MVNSIMKRTQKEMSKTAKKHTFVCVQLVLVQVRVCRAEFHNDLEFRFGRGTLRPGSAFPEVWKYVPVGKPMHIRSSVRNCLSNPSQSYTTWNFVCIPNFGSDSAWLIPQLLVPEPTDRSIRFESGFRPGSTKANCTSNSPWNFAGATSSVDAWPS